MRSVHIKVIGRPNGGYDLDVIIETALILANSHLDEILNGFTTGGLNACEPPMGWKRVREQEEIVYGVKFVPMLKQTKSQRSLV
jgi:hypothetical protein